jgi:gliding motility-associated-like protein
VVDDEYSTVQWQDGSSGLEFIAHGSGNVTITVTDEYGCTNSDTAVAVVYPAILPVSLGNDTILCGEESLILDAGDYADYDWSTGDNSPTITVYAGAGDISVTVTDVNGCTSSDALTVGECTPVDLLVIPNTFTPDGNGAHDTWIIQNIDMFPNADIQVFDRWGRLVFHGSSGDQWDGKGTNGKDLPVENYYYIIDLKSGGDDVLTGTISIVK